MKANETRVDKFLAASETQFAIPVYQRNYDWSLTECSQLLNDIIEAGKSDNIAAHFIGSIVYVHDDVYSATGVTELTIIDGQQRLTTLTLIYIAIYNLGKEIGNETLVNRINKTYLINEFAPEPEKLKLKPTDNNDKALKFIIRSPSDADFKEYSRIIDNYNHFKSRLNQENLEIVLKGLSKLIFVDISLDRQKDNPQRIFESLNSTGLELSQADLIRNYILMGLNRKDQTKIYQDYWEVIEKLAKDETQNISKVSSFIRDYLTLENKNIPNKDKVYTEFKIKYPTSDLQTLELVLSGIKSLVKYYNKLINPKNELDKEIRNALEYINRLEVNVAYPFLMKVYEDFGNDIIDKTMFISILDFIQSFTWRRFILGLPTNALNKIFMNLYDKVDKTNYLFSIQKSILSRTGVQRFPRNSETVNTLKEKDVYNIKAKNRTYLLERLENFENREVVMIDGNEEITVEHIFPQSPDVKWKFDLHGNDYIDMKEKYLNTISNLTLSGNNGKLGNRSFIEKRDMENAGYKDSRLWLNKHLSKIDKWNVTEMERRFDVISERFLNIWSIPDIDISGIAESNETNIFEAEDPKHKKLEYAIFFDQKIEVREVAKLYVDVFKKLFELQPETFFSSGIGQKIGLTRNSVETHLRQPVAINNTYFIEGNINNNNKFENIKLALTIFDVEDELTIKYAER